MHEPFDATGALVASLIDAMPEPVLVVSNSVRLLAVNGPARALFPHLRLSAPLASQPARRRCCMTPSRGCWPRDSPKMCPGSTACRSNACSRSMSRPFAFGSSRFVALTLHDATEARRVERMRVDFVANASHELRTPLASLLGFVETLQGPARDDPEAREQFLGIMREQARRMARLVDDLLSLSRIEQNLHLRPRAAVDLGGLARHIATR